MLLYIDPGTGSMLFSALIGIVGALVYFLRALFIKLKFKLVGGKREKAEAMRIPFAIFSDSKRYWNIFKPICDEFEKRGKKIVYMTASEDDPALKENYEHVKCEFIGSGNKAFTKMNFLNALIVLSTTPSLDVFGWKRSKEVKYYVHLPHHVGNLSMYRMFGIDHYDAILITGEYQRTQVRELERLRGLPEKEIVLTGIPYIDEMAKRAEKAEPLPPHKRTVLLAPSWGSNGILSRYGERILTALKATGYDIIVRPHPQSFTSEKDMIEKLMKKFPDSEGFSWNRDNDNFEVLRRSDIMISDFSGVMFEYVLIFNKPILYAEFEFDKSVYDACWLDEEPWTFRMLPEIGAALNENNVDNIGSQIDECIESEKYKNGREKMRDEAWNYRGRGTETIVNYLLAKYDELTKNESEAEEKREKKEKKKDHKKK